MCKKLGRDLAKLQVYVDKRDFYLLSGMDKEEAEKKARNYMDWSFK